MRTTIKKTRPAEEYEAHTDVCDLCGKPSGELERGYDFEETRIEFRSGSRYPGTGNADLDVFDCCGKCWRKHVVPAMEALGFRLRKDTRAW